MSKNIMEIRIIMSCTSQNNYTFGLTSRMEASLTNRKLESTFLTQIKINEDVDEPSIDVEGWSDTLTQVTNSMLKQCE